MALVIVLWSSPARAQSGMLLVTTTADEFGENPAACSLREAIQAVNTGADFGGCPAGIAGGTILLTSGSTYALTRVGSNEDLNSTGDLDVRVGVTLKSEGASAVIDGSAVNDRLLHIAPNLAFITVRLDLITLQRGQAPVGGGILVADTGTVALERVTLFDNAANQSGGGLFNYGIVSITDSVVISNTASGSGQAGGGLANFYSLTVVNSAILSNTAALGNGGGLTASGFPTLLKNVTLSGNQAHVLGGGVYVDGNLTLNNVTIVNNIADRAGSNAGDGGGIYNAGSSLTTRNSLITNNIDNSLSGNVYPDCANGAAVTLTSQGYNFIGNMIPGSGTNCSFSVQPGDQFGTSGVLNPVLGPLLVNGGQTWTHLPLAGSPLINTGNPVTPGSGGSACEANDQRLYLRQGTRCDIGAVESDGRLLMFLPLVLK